MHYSSSVYSVTILPHVSGLLVAHRQEVAMYICNKWYVLYVLVDCRRAWPTDSQLSTEDFHMKKTFYENLGTKWITLSPVFQFVSKQSCLKVGHFQYQYEHAVSYIVYEDQPRGLIVRVSDYWSWGPGFDSRFCHGDFSLKGKIPLATMVWEV
jgi:hypothetical protein